MNISKHPITIALFTALTLQACSDGYDDKEEDRQPTPPPAEEAIEDPVALSLQVGTDSNRASNPLLNSISQTIDPDGNLGLRAGDVLVGGDERDLLIGGLGVDVLIGADGDDVLIGGTEDFGGNVDGDGFGSDTRDRAFGQAGDDVFIWAPGDGSDFFDGGEGVDTVIFGVLAEARDSDGSTEGAPFFNVNPPNRDGSQDFDGIFLNEDGEPRVSVSNSPGFCTFASEAERQSLAAVDVDQIARFSLRGIANDFDDGLRSDDDGLRVTVSMKSVEFVACTRRDVVEDGGIENNVEVFDIRSGLPVAVAFNALPESVQVLIQ